MDLKKVFSVAMLVLTITTKSWYLLIAILLILTILLICDHINWRSFFHRTIFVIPMLLTVFLVGGNNSAISTLKTISALEAGYLITSNFSITLFSKYIKALNTPSYLSSILILSFRFSVSFMQEVDLIKKNIRMRTGNVKEHLFKSHYIGQIIALFFIRSIKRSERIDMSLKMRGSY